MEAVQYFNTIANFLKEHPTQILGRIFSNENYDATTKTRDAWISEIEILRAQLQSFAEYEDSSIFFEYTIPRVDGRIDCGVIINNILFVIEFKTGASKAELTQYHSQLREYVLKLKNYHFESYDITIVPVLVLEGSEINKTILRTGQNDKTVYNNCVVNQSRLHELISKALVEIEGAKSFDPINWIRSPYCPTTDIVEAARKLYSGHTVENIKRSDSQGENLIITSNRILKIIEESRLRKQKALCLITGVPGAGKTLIGLTIATNYSNPIKNDSEKVRSVYLSGNHPLVTVLQDALATDAWNRNKEKVKAHAEAIADPTERKAYLKKHKPTKKAALNKVIQFIQIIHRWRAEYLQGILVVKNNGKYEIIEDKEYYKGKGEKYLPYDHVAIFDEAQRTWDKKEHSKFVRSHGVPTFPEWSEARFLLSCMDRHPDWAVVVCLVGNGQDINHGEAGIQDWIDSMSHFKHWHVYAPDTIIEDYKYRSNFHSEPNLHLSVNLRSIRAETLSSFVDSLLKPDVLTAKEELAKLSTDYKLVVTRNLESAKQWLKANAKDRDGYVERYGIVASSKAQRLRPLAIDVSHSQTMNVKSWFLHGKDDVHSSFYMEDIATEFQIQGLEIDWACVAWDGDLIYDADNNAWLHRQFKKCGWQKINKPYLQNYHINAYRVLLTRARRGMVIYIPTGDLSGEDATRPPAIYDATYEYLRDIGIPLLE